MPRFTAMVTTIQPKHIELYYYLFEENQPSFQCKYFQNYHTDQSSEFLMQIISSLGFKGKSREPTNNNESQCLVQWREKRRTGGNEKLKKLR